jgi:tetratricopeptide (TPR) repeat protein
VTIFSLTIANWELNIEYSTLAAARLKFDRGDYAGAICLYNLEIESDKQNAESIFQRGKCHQFLGNYRQAIEDYNQSLFIAPVGGASQNENRAEVYYMLGLLHDLVSRQSLEGV